MHTPPALYFFPQAPDLTGIQHAPMPHIHHSPPTHHSHPHTSHTSQASSAVPMPHIPPSDHRETQPLQPSSAALMAHHLPSDHSIPPSAENTPLYTTNITNKGHILYIQHKLSTQAPHRLITPTTNAQDGLPEGRLHGRDPVRRSKPLVILSA